MSHSDPPVWLTPRNQNFSNDYLDFLDGYEAICDMVLAPESEPYGGFFDEKKPRVKNLVTLSL
jgi:hypothetical protein